MKLAVNLLGYQPPARPWHGDYALGIVPELLELPEVEAAELYVTPYGREHWAFAEGERVRLRIVEGLDERKRRRFYAERYILPRLLRDSGCDATFAPLGGSLLQPAGRYVYRLASLAYMLEPELFSMLEQLFYGSTIPASCKAADGVVLDTEWLADNVADHGLAPRASLRVVSPGCDAPRPSAAALPHGLASDAYLLALGDDLDGTLETFLRDLIAQARLPRDFSAVPLVWCGDQATVEPVAPRVLRMGDVDTDVLWQLLGGAAAVLCPQGTDGALAALRQALCAGAAVLAADTPALRETAGAGALLLRPGMLAEWTSALATLLGDPGQRRRLQTAARSRSRASSWKQAARAVAGLLAG